NSAWTDNKVEGDLATTWAQSADGKTVTVKLDPNAKWQNVAPVNGRAVTSADVKWLFENFGTLKSGNATAIKDVDTITAPDAQTVVFNLKTPYSGFLQSLATYTLKLVPKEQFDTDGDFTKRAIGTGAYVFDRREPNARVVVKANPNYWKQGKDGKALPYMDEIDVILGQDTATMNAAVKTGQLAFVSPDTMDPVTAKQWLADPSLQGKYTWIQSFKLYTEAIHGNLSKEPWKSNLQLRQALLHAIDMKAIAANAVQEADAPLEGPITSGMGAFSMSQTDLAKYYTYDPAMVKSLLAQQTALPAPYKIELSFILPSTPGTRTDRLSQLLGPMLTTAGFQASVYVPASPAEGYGRYFAPTGSTFQVGQTFVGYEGNIFNWWRNYFQTGGTRNWFGPLSDPALDAKIADFGATLDTNAQIAKAQDIQKYILDQAYLIPLTGGRMYVPQQASLKNFMRTWGWGFQGIEAAWIDK
ncbi:MAG: ABC transporter substrate-binding protein, partial [Chloroflexi bacterium]|nr:ABC transporter substrate-binding protein [Chloroflexota bacterium]